MTKFVFTRIFQKAWIDTIKVRTTVNGFWFMTELDACMCAVVCDKLVWIVLCAVG